MKQCKVTTFPLNSQKNLFRAGHGDRVGIDRSFFLSADEVNDTKCERAGSGRGEVDIAGAAVRTETSLGHGFGVVVFDIAVHDKCAFVELDCVATACRRMHSGIIGKDGADRHCERRVFFREELDLRDHAGHVVDLTRHV